VTRRELPRLVEEEIGGTANELSRQNKELSALATRVAREHSRELSEAVRLIQRERNRFERTQARLVVCKRATEALGAQLSAQAVRVGRLFRELQIVEQRAARIISSVRSLRALPQIESEFSALRAAQGEMKAEAENQILELREELHAGLREAIQGLGAPVAPAAQEDVPEGRT